MTSIIGWDVSPGNHRHKPLVPGDQPGQILLYQAGTRDPGATASETDLPTALDIWHLDPRLTLVATFFHQLQQGRDPANAPPKSNLVVTVDAVALVRSTTQGTQELYSLGSELWKNGGLVGDGCEISSGMHGLRFRLGATIAAATDHDIVATLVAIPNVALGCAELANSIIERLQVEIPGAITIPQTNSG